MVAAFEATLPFDPSVLALPDVSHAAELKIWIAQPQQGTLAL